MYLGNFILIVGLLLNTLFVLNAQSLETRTITNLDKKLSESSGLLILDGRFITFNDSGNKPELYEIDTTNGNIKRTVELKDAKNVDWEAISSDKDYIYVGDIGNNSGDRKNLKIYRLSIEDFLKKDKVKTKEIEFSYTNQTSFEKKSHSTIFDAEAMVIVDDNIVLFSKNWESNICFIYSFPKVEGDYSIVPMDSIVLPGKVCGATYDSDKRNLLLIGHSFEPFVTRIPKFGILPLDKKSVYTTSLVVNTSFQTEGIAFSNNVVYYTSEYFNQLDLKGVIGEIPFAATLGNIYFNADLLEIKEFSTEYQFSSSKYRIKLIEVFDEKGNLVDSKKRIKKYYKLEKLLLTKGTYNIQVLFSNKEVSRVKIIIE